MLRLLIYNALKVRRMKNLEFHELSSRAVEITPARSDASIGVVLESQPEKPHSKIRDFFFPLSVNADGVPRIVSVDILRGLRIYSIILSAEIGEMLDLSRCHISVTYIVTIFNYFLSCARFILCELIAIYGAYALCQSNGGTKEMFKTESRNVLISVIQIPLWLSFDILESQLKKIALGGSFTLGSLVSNAYPDLNIFAYFGLICIPYEFLEMLIFASFCRMSKLSQIKALAITALTLSYVWIFVSPFVERVIDPANPEVPLFHKMNGTYADYFIGLFSNFFSGGKFSFMQLFPLHLEGIYFGAMFSLFKRTNYNRSSKLWLIAIPTFIGAVLQYPCARYVAFLMNKQMRSYIFYPYSFGSYKEPSTITEEFVVFLSFWESIMLLISFWFFEAPTKTASDSRANKCLAIRRYSTLAWWAVGRNYTTTIFIRELFGTTSLTWVFIPYFIIFIVFDYTIICATDLFKCVFTHDWLLSATRSWMNSKPFSNMEEMHNKVAPAYLALRKTDSEHGTTIL